MYATNVNKFNKKEKNQKVQEGECIFPFKYQWKTHHTCVKTKKGRICATEINPKTRTLKKHGYCPPKSRTKTNSKKGTKKKAPKSKLKLVDSFTKSALREVPQANKSLEIKEKSEKIKKLKKLKLMEKSPKLKSKSNIKDKSMNKIVSNQKQERINEKLIGVLGELKDIMMRKGEKHRAWAYQKAQDTIIVLEEDITHPDQLKGKPGIGSTILSKMHEFINTGTLKVLERERGNPINVLTRVYGIGAQHAKGFISKGLTTLEDLRQNEHVLNRAQKIGLKYYDDIEKRIPREEIEEYKKVLEKIFAESAPPGSKFQIVGSFRRGAKDSGDIDMIITNEDNNKAAFNDFLDRLIKDKIVIEILNRGKIKSLTIGQLPGKTPRRLDFLYASPSEYPFTLLYFTGSKSFNTVMRQRALNMGYTLNEHGFSTKVKGVKGEKVKESFPDEASIFKFLNMKYKTPEERINSRSVQDATPSEDADEIKTKDEDFKPPDHIIDAQDAQFAALEGKHPASFWDEKLPEKPKTPQQKTQQKKPKKKNFTLKKTPVDGKKLINSFKKEGASFLNALVEDELSAMIRAANNAYYCNNDPLMTDNQYDILREYTGKKFPNNKAVKEGHTACNIEIEKHKVKLPYEMWSMDKIKPDTGALKKWMAKFPPPYLLSCKLDGVSGLYSTEGGEPKLYTRGNGKIGQDVSHLIPYLRLPKEKDITIRGEFVISKELFAKKYAEEFANPRNFVAGLVNRKKIDEEKFRDIDFVAYEVIKPELSPIAQEAYLIGLGDIEVVQAMETNQISNEMLSELLVDWRENYKYEIDGIICIQDKLYPRKTGNPEHAFAFKMVLSDQVAESKVLNVLWTPSKDGYLKPRVHIEPIVLGGATIKYATGFNGKFIEDNKIGVGALVQIVRSGDVIPHIMSVVQPAEEAMMPNVPYIWNDTHVDVMLKDVEDNTIVQEKNITLFFKRLGVDGLGTGNVRRIMQGGYTTIPQILAMSKEDFLKLEGFKEKLAKKIHEGIKTKVHDATLPELMAASNIFGRGFGKKRFITILEVQPTILTSKKSTEEKIELVEKVSGMAKKSAVAFVNKIPLFAAFMDKSKIKKNLNYHTKKPKSIDKSHDLYGKKIVMTGVRDPELIKLIEEKGGSMSTSVSKNTLVVLVKDKDEDTGKADKARKLGVTLMTIAEFRDKYKL